ncbi:coiled-coil domain-containing protein 142 isoform X2 [Alosa sapidissima]|uniref:coiled-coil domain-containing protein 142 isoform X2 n=1 Tax=Alosa sapidissima TaxID=34773 RepID=UPI001C0994B8|nr:coiled-coil domain-containing protein 142 isoform X2 [Alosa sapidissima]
MSLISITLQEGQKNVAQLGQGGMEGLQESAGHLEPHACSEGPDGSVSDDDLKRTGVFPEILSEEHLSRDSASWCQTSLTKSLQRAEALLRTRLNPSLRWLLWQKEEDGSWDFEKFIPVECVEVLKGLCSQILYNTACMQWDEVICDALGYSLKDKCLPGAMARTTMVRTATTERLVQLFNPLFMMLQHLKNRLQAGNGGRVAQLQILGALYRSVATVQSTTLWVMSKAYQFLSSWYINKFLLITQGDLVVLQASLKRHAQEVEDLNGKGGHLVIAPLTAQFTRGVADLQAFSDRILRIFSMDCKRMSIEIFEQTMPSAKHWRVNYKTELPSSPSEYATSAAQSVIGQVLEGVQPLPEEARVAALTEAMTVFMEAWMEHILKQKIKFSIQGALQLKQDFDLIRDLIQSEEYSLSEELHQRLLSLRVFQQVDSAIMCLLQQPMAKPYMPSQAWEPFRHCCPRITQVDQAAGSLNNLDSMDVQAACQSSLTHAQDSLTPELVSALPDSYLPLAQQEWLDLRIHNSSRWKLPGLHCLTRSEP